MRKELQLPTSPHIFVQQESPSGSLMSNRCPGAISSPVTRSERAWTSLIKHPDCLVLLYYHLSLPTASQVRPEAQNPENELTSLFWLIDPDFGAIGERNKGLKFSRVLCQVSLFSDSPELSRSCLTFPTQRPVTGSLCKPCKCCN